MKADFYIVDDGGSAHIVRGGYIGRVTEINIGTIARQAIPPIRTYLQAAKIPDFIPGTKWDYCGFIARCPFPGSDSIPVDVIDGKIRRADL